MSGRVYSFLDFLPGTRAENGAYAAGPFFDEFKLVGTENRISRPVVMLAEPAVLRTVYEEPPRLSMGPDGFHPTTPAAGMQHNESVIAQEIGNMLEAELKLRLTPIEHSLVRDEERLKTPNEMIVDALKEDMALIQMYFGLLVEGKFDMNNKTMMQNSQDAALRVNEALRQPHNFADVPELPILARRELDAFLAALSAESAKVH
jgi:hypothetical protein